MFKWTSVLHRGHGFNTGHLNAVNKTNIKKNNLNFDMLDRRKSERSTGVFLFRFGFG